MDGFGHSVKSPFLSVSLTHQPFHFSSSTLRLHPSFKAPDLFHLLCTALWNKHCFPSLQMSWEYFMKRPFCLCYVLNDKTITVLGGTVRVSYSYRFGSLRMIFAFCKRAFLLVSHLFSLQTRALWSPLKTMEIHILKAKVLRNINICTFERIWTNI